MRTTPLRLLLPLLALPIPGAHAQDYEAYLEEEEELEAPGHLEIVTRPPGAEILVDGRPWPRRSPATLEGLPAGEHQLTFIRDDLFLQTTVVVLAGETKTIDVDLRAPAGAIKVISDPSPADVYLNGILQGQTPLVLPVPFGTHRLRVARTGHKSFEVPLEITNLDQMRVAVHLERLSGPGEAPVGEPYTEEEGDGRQVTAVPGAIGPGAGPGAESGGASINFWPWIVFGGGVALVGAGIGFEVHAADAASVAADERERYTLAKRASVALKHYDNAEHNRDIAESNETAAWALMGSGAALMIGGLIWYFLDPDDPPPAKAAVAPAPGGATLQVGGRW